MSVIPHDQNDVLCPQSTEFPCEETEIKMEWGHISQGSPEEQNNRKYVFGDSS